MKNVVSILNNSDMSQVLGLYLSDKFEKKQKSCFNEWFSVYCYFVEACFPKSEMKMVITRYRVIEEKNGKTQYDFYGILNPSENGSDERLILWSDVLKGQIELLIPECILSKIDNNYLAFVILEGMSRNLKIHMVERSNEKLYERARTYAKGVGDKNQIEALHRGIEKVINYDINPREIQNEILELFELKQKVLTWGEVLKCKRGYMKEFRKLSEDNPGEYNRATSKKEKLLEEYCELDMEDYLKVMNERNRIVVEASLDESMLPFVYVLRKDGTKEMLMDVDEKELICMDIRVFDESYKTTEQILALLMFYLEYPLRVNRILAMQEKQKLVNIFVQMTGECGK